MLAREALGVLRVGERSPDETKNNFRCDVMVGL